MQKNWNLINNSLRKSQSSISKPEILMDGPRAVRITPHSKIPEILLTSFSRFKYCLITDVARCYPSIYTHSIPWAIHGKANSKLDTKINFRTIIANKLDASFRAAQYGQTIGIPVGTDTSRLVAEIILSAVDAKFDELCEGESVKFVRHVDDYWVAGSSIEHCHRYLQKLRAALREYELDVNDLKTKIVPTSQILGDSWPAETEARLKHVLSAKNGSSKYDIVAAFSGIIDNVNRNNDEGIIRHAIKKIDQHQLWISNWNIIEHFLAHVSIQFPHCFDYVARVVSWRVRRGLGVEVELWRDIAGEVIVQNAALARDSEALWALWLLKEINSHTPIKASEVVLKNCSPLVKALLFRSAVSGLTDDKELAEKIIWSADLSDPYGREWPLLMEINHHLDGVVNETNAEYDSMYEYYEKKCSLISWDAKPVVFDEESEEGPDHAIEDYVSAYDDESDEVDGDDQSEAEEGFDDTDGVSLPV